MGPEGEEDKDLRLQNIINKLKKNADEAHIKEVSFILVNKCQYSLTFILLTSFQKWKLEKDLQKKIAPKKLTDNDAKVILEFPNDPKKKLIVSSLQIGIQNPSNFYLFITGS